MKGLDQRDRRALSAACLLTATVVVVVLTLACTAGLAVRVFAAAAGWGG